MRRTTPLLFALVIALGPAVAACAGSDADDDAALDTSATTTPAPTGTQTSDTETSDTPTTDAPTTDTPTTEPLATEAPATEAPATEPPASSALAPLPSDGLGPYQVGVQTITITDSTRKRPLTVDVWFPLAEGTEGDPHRYTFVTGDYYQSPNAIDAEPAAASPDGPFPLVVYSHGSGGLRYIHSDYTETLASHGYLVVAPDHTGNTAIERVAGTSASRDQIALDRPRDVRAVIDAMLNPESTETAPFVPLVNPEDIAVTGHSFGGFTAYAVASGYANDLGSVEPDPRVDAIIPLAPAVGGDDPSDQLLSDGRLEAITTPALVMVGTNDMTTPIDPNVTRAWNLTRSEPSYRLELVDAQHNTFTDLCAYLDFFPTLPDVTQAVIDTIEDQAAEGCSPGDMAIPRAQELTNTFAVTFLDSIFDDAAMITPDAYAIPDDVEYLVK